MKEYMKMSDVFNVNVRVSSCIADGFTYYGLCGDDITNYASFNGNGKAAKYSAHAINSHDDLVQMNKELLAALEDVASSGRGSSGRIILDSFDEECVLSAIAKAKGGAA